MMVKKNLSKKACEEIVGFKSRTKILEKRRWNKKAQEEMVGFGLIIIIVAVILLIFLSIALRGGDEETVQSYEVESFVQAYLQHTSDCRKSDNLEYLSVQKLIFNCESNANCLDGRNSCDALNETTVKILDEYWKYGDDRPIKGRTLEIVSEGKELLKLSQGNITSNSKGAIQEFYRSGNNVVINFNLYY